MTKVYGVAVKMTQVKHFKVEVENLEDINLGVLLNNDLVLGGIDWDMSFGTYTHPPKYEIEDIWNIEEGD